MARTQLDDLNDQISALDKVLLNAINNNDYPAWKKAMDKRSELISIKINIQ
jgi:hypothetical protein|tara:strand:+ start:6128 stop:6280 length:153 start_codon:yes stop_codon:yes gene_type:complete